MHFSSVLVSIPTSKAIDFSCRVSSMKIYVKTKIRLIEKKLFSLFYKAWQLKLSSFKTLKDEKCKELLSTIG